MSAAQREPLHRSRSCFVCGTENPQGLNLAPMREGKKVCVEYVPSDTYRGFANAIHGGLSATLLDEVMGQAAGIASDGKAATVELTVTYRAPVRSGAPLRVEGWSHRRKGRFVYARGRILAVGGKDDGRVLVEARGRFLALDDRILGRFLGDRPKV